MPKPDFKEIEGQIFSVVDIINRGFALAVHDISEGGIAVALAEMSFKNGIGFDVNIETDLRIDKALYSETGGFVLEIPKRNLSDVEKILARHSCDYYKIGKTNLSKRIHIKNAVDVDVETAKHAWLNGLRNKLL